MIVLLDTTDWLRPSLEPLLPADLSVIFVDDPTVLKKRWVASGPSMVAACHPDGAVAAGVLKRAVEGRPWSADTMICCAGAPPAARFPGERFQGVFTVDPAADVEGYQARALARHLIAFAEGQDREEEVWERIDSLFRITQAISSTFDQDEMLYLIVSQLASQLRLCRCSIVLIPAAGEVAVVLASHESREIKDLTIQLAKYPELRKVFATSEMVLVNDVASDPLMAPVIEQLRRIGFASILVIPIRVKEHLVGALFLRAARSGGSPFSEEDIKLGRIVADAAGVAMENAALYRRLMNHAGGLQRDRDELVRKDMVKTDLIGKVSHELRSPLAVIRGYLSLMVERKFGTTEKELMEGLSVCNRRARQLQGLVEEILDISRINAGELTGVFEPVDLRRIVADAVEAFRDEMAERSLPLELILPEGELVFPADSQKILHVVNHLVSNAVKFNTVGGVITVSLREEAPGVVLEVADRGIGIPPEELERIFEPFHQIAHAGGKKPAGAGLGLTVVRAFVNLHGGTVEVVALPPPGGTMFRVTLPRGRVAEVPSNS